MNSINYYAKAEVEQAHIFLKNMLVARYCRVQYGNFTYMFMEFLVGRLGQQTYTNHDFIFLY